MVPIVYIVFGAIPLYVQVVAYINSYVYRNEKANIILSCIYFNNNVEASCRLR